MIDREKIYDSNYISVCYFRSTADSDHKKVILQITERCNMFCKHCFVSSTKNGKDLSFEDIKEKILPKLLEANVSKVTLTGGEPLVHPKVYEIIELLTQNNISVAICTNGLLINRNLIELCRRTGKVHFNISLDGFSAGSHGKFRGIESQTSFQKIIKNISDVGNSGMLNGILVTPNIFAQLNEYPDICDFAKKSGAKYVLFNPLSEFGRGQETKFIGYHGDELLHIKKITQKYIDDNFEVVYIRFPDSSKKMGNCHLGKVLYVFTNGNIAICPYIVFASYNKDSLYQPSQFFISNILDENCNINRDLKNYILPQENGTDYKCKRSESCSKGCLASKVSNGLSIYNCDFELCNKKFVPSDSDI